MLFRLLDLGDSELIIHAVGKRGIEGTSQRSQGVSQGRAG
jgi:hypothetical protein